MKKRTIARISDLSRWNNWCSCEVSKESVFVLTVNNGSSGSSDKLQYSFEPISDLHSRYKDCKMQKKQNSLSQHIHVRMHGPVAKV